MTVVVLGELVTIVLALIAFGEVGDVLATAVALLGPSSHLPCQQRLLVPTS